MTNNCSPSSAFDIYAIRRCVELASQNLSSGARPFAAVLAIHDKVILELADQTIALRDPTAHPELASLRLFCQHHPLSGLRSITMYTNVEPCPMCAGAIHYSGIRRLVYSVPRSEFDAVVAGARGRRPKKYSGCREIIEDGGVTNVHGPVLVEEGLAILSTDLFLPHHRCES